MKRPPEVDPPVWQRRHREGGFTLQQTRMGFQRLVFDAFPTPWAPYQGFKDRLASFGLDSHWGGSRSEIFTVRRSWSYVWASLCTLTPAQPERPFPLDQVSFLEETDNGALAKDASGKVILKLTTSGRHTALEMGVPLLLDPTLREDLCHAIGDCREP